MAMPHAAARLLAPIRWNASRAGRIAPLPAVALGCALLAVPGSAWAHPGQSLSLRIEIDDEAVRHEVVVSADFLTALAFAYGYDLEPPRRQGEEYVYEDPAHEARWQEIIAEIFTGMNPVEIDGIEVQPIIRAARFIKPLPIGPPDSLQYLPPDLLLVLEYPAKGRPTRVSLVWDIYPQDPSRARYGLDTGVEVVAQLIAYGTDQIISFTPEEPEYIWHATPESAEEQVAPVVARVSAPTVTLPGASLTLIAAWLLALGLTQGLAPADRRLGRRSLLLGSVAVVLLAAGSYNFARVPVPAPWERAVAVPTPTEAAGIFTTLHRNVYRAFDYTDESRVYDVLAQSVDGALLDRLYNEVYQSLILRDQGGAVARIKDVEILATNFQTVGLIPEQDAVAFRLASRWQVHGAVYHWGHVHARTNEYSAVFTVAQHDQAWRITAVEDMTQQRVVRPGDDPEPDLPLPPATP
jgi:hypothetical protein